MKMIKLTVIAFAMSALAFEAAAVDEPVDGLGGYPPNAEGYKERGAAADAKGDYAKAIEYYDKSIELNPRDGTLWHYKAQAYKEMEMYEEAIECYERAIEYYDMVISIHPYDGETWWMKGSALKKLGKYGRANDCFEQAKEYGYEAGDE
ncbi:MAG: tetratricopeptide repeat protein [bacterium]|nr:tetratricopeptide repeat protein [bacterium]